jgi:hypothetical protein
VRRDDDLVTFTLSPFAVTEVAVELPANVIRRVPDFFAVTVVWV